MCSLVYAQVGVQLDMCVPGCVGPWLTVDVLLVFSLPRVGSFDDPWLIVPASLGKQFAPESLSLLPAL